MEKKALKSTSHTWLLALSHHRQNMDVMTQTFPGRFVVRHCCSPASLPALQPQHTTTVQQRPLDGIGEVSLGHSPCPHTRTLNTASMQPHAAPVYSIMVSTPVMQVITWITTHLPTLAGRKAELGLVGWPKQTVDKPVNHRLGASQGSPPTRDQRLNHGAILQT